MKLTNENGVNFEPEKMIRCKNTKDERVCNNLLCLVKGSEILIKRHGRQIGVPVGDYSIEIVCERCKKATKISFKS